MNLTDFYDHGRAMRHAREGERLIAKLDAKLRTMKPETTTLNPGDRVEATASATVLQGVKGTLKAVERNGKFLALLVQWDGNRWPHYERLKDVHPL